MASCRELWEQLAAAENRHDTGGHDALMHADVVVHVPGGAELLGVEAYRSMMQGFFELLPDYHATVLTVADDGDDRVLVHWRIAGTASGGQSVDYTGCSVWRADGERIVEGWLYPDRAAMQAQLDS